MNFKLSFVAPLFVLMACGQPASEPETQPVDNSPNAEAVNEQSQITTLEVAPGLSARILTEGGGNTAGTGQIAVVHYTGWLYDETADNNRGKKFDSSVDRDEYFSFMLGAGRVIKGWDQGVTGMKLGEKRELTIAPEMGYGDRGAGAVIPPGATLIFEIELVEIQGAEPAPTE